MRLPLFLLLANAAFCGIRGTVVDPSGAVVAGVKVSATSRQTTTTVGTRTGADGKFDFEDLAAGDYAVQAAAEFASALEPRVADGATITLRLRLTAVTASVNVTASALAQSVDEIAKASDVVDRAQMEQRNEPALLPALRLLPGMRVTQLGGPGALIRVLTRGLRAFDTSLLIDGYRFRDAAAPQGDATAYFADLLNLDTDRVEVVRGSGSSLYGTHSSGGVINVVTSPGGGPLNGELLAEGGGLGSARFLARAGGGLLGNRVQYSLGAGHWNVTRGADGYDPYRNWSLQSWLQFRPAKGTAIGVRIFGNTSMVALNGFVSGGAVPPTGDVNAIAGQTFFVAPDDSDYRRNSHFISTLVSLTQEIGTRFSMRAGYQALRSARDNRDGPGGTGYQPVGTTSNAFNGTNDIVTLRADALLARWNTLSGGYEYERERFDNTASDGSSRAFTSISQHGNTGWVQNQTRLFADRLQISLSGRTQAFELESPRFAGGAPRYTGASLDAPPNAYTGDGAVSWFAAGTGTKLRAHYGNGYRAPSLYERFGTTYYGGSFSPLGDPRLRPERATSADGGVDQYFGANRVRVSATYFYTRLNEVIAYDSLRVRPATDPFGRYGGYANTGGGLARGAEFSLEAAATRRTRIQASYTYTKSQERVSALVGGSIRTPRIPDHTFTMLLSQSIGKRADVVFDFVATSNTLVGIYAGSGTRAFLFPGPRTGNLSFRYDVPLSERTTLRFYTRLENIFNNTWYAEGFRTPGFWGVGGLKLLF